MFEFNLYAPKKETIELPFYFYRRNPTSTIQKRGIDSWRQRADSYYYSTLIYKKYYDLYLTLHCANRLMESLWRLMDSLAHLPLNEGKDRLRKLRHINLYPFNPPEHSICKSYATTRTDFIGKVFETIWCNMHTRKGFWLRKLWIFIEKKKNRN